MPTFSIYRYSSTLFRLIFCSLTLTAKPISSFSFQAFNRNNFDSEIALYGDARISNDGSFVTLTRPMPSSFGLLAYNRGFKFLEATSFSTDFSFKISSETGDGLALIIVPSDFASKLVSSSFGLSQKIRFLGVEFDTSMDANVGDPNGNHVGIDVGSLVSASLGNVSSIDLVLNSGEILRSWIDYIASSKRLEVRVGKLGISRPNDPVLSYPIDLPKMWNGEEVSVGISSSSGNSSQTSSVYSWRFALRSVPNWLHSQPVDPRRQRGEPLRMQKSSVCPLTVIAGVIFVTGCLALVAFVVLFVWAIFIGRHTAQVAEEEYPKLPVDFRYRKINVEEDVK